MEPYQAGDEKEFMNDPKKESIEFEKADAQFIGFLHANQGYSISDLVQSMGLNERDWLKIKKKHKLNMFQVDEIENYFHKNG